MSSEETNEDVSDSDEEELWEDPKEVMKRKKREEKPLYKKSVVDKTSPFNIMQVGCVSMLQVGLNSGETIRAESDALVTAMPAKVKISASTNGGVLQAASRALAGESFFLQEVTAQADGVMLEMSPKAFHGLSQICLKDGTEYYVRKDGFFAAQRNIKCSGTLAGAKEFMAQSLTLLQVTGSGWFVVEAFGGVKPLCIPKGASAIVDNSHLVAWPTHADYSVRRASNSVLDSMMSGEYIVLKFKGPCTVYVSYARSATVDDRVSQVADQRQRQTIGGGLGAILSGLQAGGVGAAISGLQAGGVGPGIGTSIERTVKGFFRGIAMTIIVLFVLVVVFPRFFM
jgi:uncharacterized protein (TIGR00266 family)